MLEICAFRMKEGVIEGVKMGQMEKNSLGHIFLLNNKGVSKAGNIQLLLCIWKKILVYLLNSGVAFYACLSSYQLKSHFIPPYQFCSKLPSDRSYVLASRVRVNHLQ